MIAAKENMDILIVFIALRQVMSALRGFMRRDLNKEGSEK